MRHFQILPYSYGLFFVSDKTSFLSGDVSFHIHPLSYRNLILELFTFP